MGRSQMRGLSSELPLSAAPTTGGSRERAVPHAYEVSGEGLSISFFPFGSTPSETGAVLVYNNGVEEIVSQGDDLSMAFTPVGTLVTARIRRSTEADATYFTLLVPNVSLDDTSTAPLQTLGFHTIARNMYSAQGRIGQKDLYTVYRLLGVVIGR
jgi:hypothetical protein